ncbi:molybdopterin-dependent oxidoreductase [Nocardia jinanensis]|uniref:Oxidoreductase n=1 Tax=Nocardia jinanensis TaxID=382504 RepID=A0A917RSZ3_9NOCA|nr:molybdopterin-dependent oxidoreductase [Nocardia jinanensis]GGL26677.1 putative oxidoreductase [Nocardia jinanensis]
MQDTTSSTGPTGPDQQDPDTTGRFAAALSGLAAAAVVLGIGELAAALIAPEASPFLATGATVVDHTPRALREFAIEQFGTRDKLVLFLCMGLMMVVLAVVAGLLERRRPYGSALLAGLAVAVGVAVLQRPNATAAFTVPILLGAAAGVCTLRVLITRAPRHAAAGGSAEGTATDGTDASRRRFLGLAAGALVLAAGSAAAGRWAGERARAVTADLRRFVVPRPQVAAAPVPPGTDPPVPGITDFITPNDTFYRIDTALRIPALTSADWRLRIHGMVEREIELTMDDLLRRPAVEKVITLTCVSNEVGGDLIGNATWIGYPLADLLAEAGVRPDADMVLSTSADGFTAGTPVAALTDGRDALLAVGMNGEPLSVAHGYPARMVVPGLYGYVSATKWVVDLEITRFDRAQAYWTRRGWSAFGPIKTASRIDVPAAFGSVAPGPAVVAGVAWAQHRGVAAVEVQVDDGPWQPAELAPEYSLDTWRQWTWRWDATPGSHTLRVRATDGTGRVQTEERADPVPDGATGRHSRTVTVR